MQNYFNQNSFNSPVGPSVPDVANYILLNAARGSSVSSKQAKSQPSIMSRIFDILSRPNYAVANTVKGLLGSGEHNPAADFISGLAGTQKTTFSDVLEQEGASPVPAAILGLALDVGADPTTYIGGAGLISKFGKAGKVAEEASKEIPLGKKLLDSGEAIHPESFDLAPRTNQAAIPTALRKPAGGQAPPQLIDDLVPSPKTAKEVNPLTPERVTPVGEQLGLNLDLTKEVPDLERVQQSLSPRLADDLGQDLTKSVKGQTSLRFPDFNLQKIRAATEAGKVQKATDIVNKVAGGDLAEALKLVPPPRIVVRPSDRKLAEEIANSFDPAKSTATINKQYPNTLNAKQQVKLYYRVRDALNKKGPLSARRTDAVYKAVEDELIKRNYIPRLGTGENVKLSDVIADLKTRGLRADYENLREFGDSVGKDTPVGQAIEAMRARNAIIDSVKVKPIVDAISESKAETKAKGMLSDAQTKDFDKFLKNFGKASAKTANVSPAGEKATKGLIEQAMIAGKSPAQVVLEQKSKMLDDIIAGGKTKRAEINKVTTLALEKDLGKLPKWVVDDNRSTEWLMGRVATWWGQSDLRQMSLQAIASSAATAEARGRVLANLFKGFDTTQRAEALRLAQGYGRASTPEVEQLGTQIKRILDDLLGQASGSSVLLRSGVDMNYLNKWMRRYGTGFEFTKGKAKNLAGEELDFSKGTDWLSSWEVANVTEDAASWIFKVQQAIEQATREKALYDELGERFGSQIAGKGFHVKLEGHPYIKDYYFPKDIAQQIPRMIKDWTPGTTQNIKALKFYDRALSMWKTNVTIYRPGFHFRNVVGDMYMGLLDGVTSIRPYQLAFKVQRFMKGAYTDLADIDRMIELGAASERMRTPLPGDILFRNKSGYGFTAEQIAAVAQKKGLLESVKTLEDIIDLGDEVAGARRSITRPFGGKVQAFAGGISELQHHNARLAHFIDKIAKSTGNDFPKIFEDAARRSRKFHPSGLDLTDFEKKFMRRIIPFYSWLRKSTPVLLEGIVMKPGVTVLPAKINQALQEASGVQQTDGRSDPFPVDQMFPEWLRAQGVGPISLPDGILGNFSNQTPPGYVMGGMGLNPLTSLIAQFEDPGRTAITSMTPAAQIPIELMTGKKLFTGEPIRGDEARPGAFGEYVGSNIPLYSFFQGLTGITPFGGQTKAVQRGGSDAQTENLVNFLTGAGIKGTGPYIKSAQYEARQPGRIQRNATRDEYLAQLREQLGL